MKHESVNWYACSVCGASFAASGVVGPLKCWRTDCPGRNKPDPPKVAKTPLRVV